MTLGDCTWYLIFRNVRGEPLHHSHLGVVDALPADSEALALKRAMERNPVRGCEYLEAKPVSRCNWPKAKQIKRRRDEANREFLELLEGMLGELEW